MGGDAGGFGVVNLDDGRVLIAYYAKADRSKVHENPTEFGKLRIELAWLKKVKAAVSRGGCDSKESRAERNETAHWQSRTKLKNETLPQSFPSFHINRAPRSRD